MELLHALLEAIFGKKQCAGTTCAMSIYFVSPTLCSNIRKFSTAGGDETCIFFDPPLPIEEALLASRHYAQKGTFTHTSR